MFIHHLKYTIKTLFKNKSLIFWTFAFPIFLSLFFQFAFSDIENNEKLSIIPIAIVENDELQNQDIFKKVFEELSDENNDDRLFSSQYVQLSKAQELLSQNEIIGYVYFNDEQCEVVTANHGVYETILTYVVDEVTTSTKMASTIANIEIARGEMDYTRINQKISQLLSKQESHIQDESSSHMSYMMVEYYTLIAMTCLYGGVIVMEAMNQSLANMTSIGKRVGISPVKKSHIVISSMIASYIIQFLGVLILLFFTKYIQHVDYGSNMGLLMILCACGTLSGLAIGLFISIIVKAHENTKVGIIIAVSMAMSILSGMTGVTLKYVIDQNIPLLNKVNPANMITDGIYALYYYGTNMRYMTNVLSLLIFSMIIMIISAVILRRQKYDSL